MPIYSYRCDACGFAKDVLQKLADAPLTQCPACEANAFKKQLTSAGFHLKGSGWYKTDFRDSGKPVSKSAASSDGEAAPKSSDKSGDKGSDDKGGNTSSDQTKDKGKETSGDKVSSSASGSGEGAGAKSEAKTSERAAGRAAEAKPAKTSGVESG